MTTTVTSIYPSSNRSIPSTATAVSNPIDPRRDQAFFTANTHSNGPRISRSVDGKRYAFSIIRISELIFMHL